MTAQSGLGFSGIVAIQIPDDGATGEVLTKQTPDNYDYDWDPVAGGFAPDNAEYVVLALDGTLTDERVLTPGTSMQLTDGGANGNVTLDVEHLEFVAVAANPGGVPANTLYMDDGTNFDANTVVMGDFSVPMLLTGNVGINDPGTEQGGINVGGFNFDATAKVNDFGGSIDAMLVLHRHSTSFGSNLIMSRSNSDTSAHIALTPGQVISQIVNVGWSGTHYDIAGIMQLGVPSGSTVSPTSLAGEYSFFTTPDGSNTALLALLIGSDQSIQFSGAYTFPTVDGTLDQMLSTDGAGQLSFVDRSEVTNLFLSGLFGTILNLEQTFGASPISVDLAAALGLSSLQTLYDVDPDVPQITVNAADELTIDANVVGGDVFAVRDEADVDLMRMRTTGSDIFGGTGASDILNLQGANAANRGTVNIHGTTLLDFDWISDLGFYAIRWANTIPASGPGVVGLFQVANVITVDNSVFISSTVDDLSTISWTVAPGFAVQTLFFARPTYQSITPAIAPSQAFVFGAQAQYRLTGAGSVTVPTYRALSFSPIIRVDNAGDELHLTTTEGLTLQPLFNTRNATAVADYGIIRGVHMLNASTILFGLGIGSEIADDWIGLDVELLSGLIVSGTRVAVRSAIVNFASNYLIQNLGGAQSEFGDGDVHVNDDVSFSLGNTIAAPDAEVQWLPANNALDFSGGRIRVRGAVEYPPITPAALGAGNTNDWTGLLTDAVSAAMRHWARISGNVVTSVLTGIDTTVVEDGDTFELTNISANAIDITHQDVASIAANRFITPTGVTYVLAADETVIVRYDTTTSRWRLLGGTGA
jgi:hypothetical protein